MSHNHRGPGHIGWGRFRIYDVNDGDLDQAADMEFPFAQGSKFRAVCTGIDEPGVQVNFEDFTKGPEIVWTLAHDEIQYVTSGEAEIEYHNPPLMTESGKVIARPGSIYLMPRGCRVVWRVLSDEPFRHLCICCPNPGYPIATAHSVREA